jgi:predicted phage terminase large subunit-like protein
VSITKRVPKTPAGHQKCTACKAPKLLNCFMPQEKVCIECATAQKLAAEAPPEPQIGAVEAQDEFPHVELDYEHPTTAEMAARTLCRRNLLQFIRRFRPKYEAGWVHRDICRRLEQFMRDVEQGKEPRLLLMMPVRMGKSEIASRHFAPFLLGHHPEWEIIAASGAQSLATSFSRYIRDLLRNDAYQSLFPRTKLDPQGQAVENWNTTLGGGYLAAGTGTMITGRGAHVLIIDDPVKDAEAADSQLIRDNVWEWYISTALSRLAPGGGVLGILTWWNEDDWAGRVQQLSEMEGGDTFEIVKYPAINDIGDEYILDEPSRPIVQLRPGTPVPEGALLTRKHMSALHPERYTLESLLRRKATYYALGQQRWWAALYQQNPTPEEGAYFTKAMFHFYSARAMKHERSTYQAWDFAITEKAQADYTVGVTVDQDAEDTLYVADVTKFRSGDSFIIADAVLDYWELHGSCALIGFEDSQIWRSIEAVFKKRCMERGLYPSYEIMKPFTDKMVRAQPLRGRMQSGKLKFNNRAAWWDETSAEMLRFPAGKHDDVIDALSWAVRLILTKSAPRLATPRQLKSWKDSLPGSSKRGGAMAA